jgi:hypothetical protein
MGIEKGEEVQAKGIRNMFNKIITEKFPNLEKEIPIHVLEACSTPNRHDQNRISLHHVIVKTQITGNKGRVLKSTGKKHQMTYKG